VNTLGNNYRITSFGESHGRCVGVVVDGCPAGLPITGEFIQKELDRRKPGQNAVSTSRSEEDQVEILSGLYKGYTTGAPICMLVWNRDRDSSGYEKRRWTPRPGHADYTARIRYGGYNDYRGGGRFSGRLTAGYVMAGAVAKRLLTHTLGVEVLAHTSQVGEVKAPKVSVEEIRKHAESNPVRCGDPETAARMEEAITSVSQKGNSLGGVVECVVLNMPAGLGQPLFDTLEGDLAKALFAIPAVKAVEFGLGTVLSSMKGSEANDPFMMQNGVIRTMSNNFGGILGGLSNGMPITCRVSFKPTPSISLEQSTVDIQKMEDTSIRIDGRHDPCIVPRAVPVVEAMIAVVLTDHALQAGVIGQVLGGGINE
jgi:chorismate synthase